MSRLNVRARLTLWYGGVLAVVLIAFTVVVYFDLRHDLLERVDGGLHEELADVLFEVRRAQTTAGLLEWLDRRFAHHAGFDFQITTADGTRFFASERLADRTLPVPRAISAREDFQMIEFGGRYRVVTARAAGPAGTLTIQIARSMQAIDGELDEMALVFLTAVPAAMLAALGGGYFLARRALAPVQAITDAAQHITAERLDRRIEVGNRDDELGALAGTLNGMIERLETSFREIQRFTADAAHELRTPLTIIRNEAEVTLRASRSAEEYARTLENILEETECLTQLADQLLFLCRHDAGLIAQATKPIAVDEVIHDVVGQMQLSAQEKGVALSLDENTPCTVTAESTQLRRVFYNLIDNAIKYSAGGGRIAVRSATENGSLMLTVADNGVGISGEHLPHVFERFYRADPARSQNGSGAGLGLPICQAVVKALGGTIRIESTFGEGTTVTVTIPCAGAPGS